MRKIITAVNLSAVFLAFLVGMIICNYEDRYSLLFNPEIILYSQEQMPAKADNPAPGSININTASVKELIVLNGIGEKLAQRIIDYREDNGAFEVSEDIMKVSGISKSLFDRISDKICVN